MSTPVPVRFSNRVAGAVAFSGASDAPLSRLEDVVRPALEQLAAAYFERDVTLFVTGACLGVDAYCAAYLHAAGCYVHTVVPGNRSRVDPDWREHCTSYELMPPDSPYRARNTRMVAIASQLVAFPALTEEQERGTRGSGTWMTIRIAGRAPIPADVHPLGGGRG